MNHACFRSELTARRTERWTSPTATAAVITVRPTADADAQRTTLDITLARYVTPPAPAPPDFITDCIPTHSRAGTRLFADWTREIREVQKRGDPFSTRSRANDVRDAALGSMARAVEVKAVNGRARTKKVRGMF